MISRRSRLVVGFGLGFPVVVAGWVASANIVAERFNSRFLDVQVQLISLTLIGLYCRWLVRTPTVSLSAVDGRENVQRPPIDRGIRLRRDILFGVLVTGFWSAVALTTGNRIITYALPALVAISAAVPCYRHWRLRE